MRCTTCNADNREGRRFCGQCGASLTGICPGCGFTNEPDDRFCGECGQPLAGASGAAGRRPRAAAAEGDRRQITVMFCDMVDSTLLGQRYDPEEVQRLLQGLRRLAAELVARFDGVVTQYLGDGILASFGYPSAHEDDAERAIRAALEIIAAMAAWREREPAPLHVRIGISTGLVVTALSAEGEETVLSMVGDPLNLASRLQTLAPKDGIVIGPLTKRLVGDLFETRDMGRHSLKGFEEPVQVWEVVREHRGGSRFEAQRAASGLSDFVGREREQRLLHDLWRRARSGEGQVGVFVGEAGIGKSRIVEEFSASIADDPHSRVRYFCLPYFQNTAFYPIVDQLERAAGIEPSQPVAEKLQRLQTTLSELIDVSGTDVALFGRMMGIDPAGELLGPADITPQQQRERFQELLIELATALAGRRPLLLIAEDAHWMDPSSAEFFDRLVPRLQGLPVLLLITARPEFQPSWRDEAHVTLTTLNRLSRAQVSQLVEAMADGVRLPKRVVEQIVERTDGVPLFVEELTRHMLESGLLDQAGDLRDDAAGAPSLAVPNTLRDSLMARLDRLSPVKLVAQAGAVIGRRFRYDLLAAVLERSGADLDPALHHLADAGLILRRGTPPQATYSFRHALVQDIAYESLLNTRRQALHRRVARVIEERFPQLARQQPETLAQHFRDGNEPERAIPYALAAGDAAAARYATVEARARYEAAREMAEALPPSADSQRLRITCVLKLAAVATNRAQFESDLERLADLRQVAEKLDDAEALSRVLYWMGRLEYVLGRFEDAARLAEESLTVAEAAGGTDALTADPVNLLGRLGCLRGLPREAAMHAARNVGQMRNLGNRLEEAAITGVLAFALGMGGRFGDALATADRGIELARQVDHLPTLAAAHFYRGVVQGWRGVPDAFVPDFEVALELADRAGDVFRRYLALGWRGQGFLVARRLDAAGSDLEASLELAQRIGTRFHLGAFTALLAELRALEGNPGQAIELSRKAVEVAQESGQAWSLSIALRVRAEALLAAGNGQLDGAEQAVRRAIEIQQARDCRYDLAWSHLVHGDVLAARGAFGEAQSALHHAETMFNDMGIERGLLRSRTSLQQLH